MFIFSRIKSIHATFFFKKRSPAFSSRPFPTLCEWWHRAIESVRLFFVYEITFNRSNFLHMHCLIPAVYIRFSECSPNIIAVWGHWSVPNRYQSSASLQPDVDQILKKSHSLQNIRRPSMLFYSHEICRVMCWLVLHYGALELPQRTRERKGEKAWRRHRKSETGWRATRAPKSRQWCSRWQRRCSSTSQVYTCI